MLQKFHVIQEITQTRNRIHMPMILTHDNSKICKLKESVYNNVIMLGGTLQLYFMKNVHIYAVTQQVHLGCIMR